LIAILLPMAVVGTALWDYSFFSWHPICLSIAYGFLMSQGILLFSPHSSLAPSSWTRSSKVTYHTYILLVALAVIYAGQCVIYTVKESKGKAHFTTWHGLFGLTTVAYTTVQVLAGVLVKYARSVPSLTKLVKLADLKFYHGTSGCALFVLSCATLALGLSSSWFVANANEYLRGACFVAVALLGMAILNHGYTLVSGRLANVRASSTSGK